MTNDKSSVLIFACLFLANAAWCPAKEEAASPEALISRARLHEDIWTEGTPPTLMRAEIQVSDPKGALVHGDYTLDWVSPSQWRKEIRFPNYERLRVRDAKGYWQKSGLSYEPEIIFQLDTILHLKDAFRVRSKQTLGKIRSRGKAGVRQNCTEVKWTTGTDRIMCFDEANGALVSIEYPRRENQNPPEISRIEYGAFNTVGGKLFPYEIRALKDRKVIAAAKVLEIAKITEENPALFNVPMNGEFWAQCDDMQEAELVDQRRLKPFVIGTTSQPPVDRHRFAWKPQSQRISGSSTKVKNDGPQVLSFKLPISRAFIPDGRETYPPSRFSISN